MADDNNIFPLIDRNTPVINRLRNGVGNKGETISQAITQLISEDNEENKRAIADETVRQIKEDLSGVSGVPEESLEGRFFDDLRDNLTKITPGDILIDDQGQSEDQEGEESDEQDEDNPDQSELEKF